MRALYPQVSLVYQQSHFHFLRPVIVHDGINILGRHTVSAALSPSRKSIKEFTLKILLRITCLASVSTIPHLRSCSQFVASVAFTFCESTWYRIAKWRAGSSRSRSSECSSHACAWFSFFGV